MREREERTRFSTVPLRTQRSEPKSLGRVVVVVDEFVIVLDLAWVDRLG
jgi:hypothetical protein